MGERLVRFGHAVHVFARLLLNGAQAGVHDLFGGVALPVTHQRADELRHQRAAVDRIERHFTFWNFSASWHKSVSSYQLSASSQTQSAPSASVSLLKAGSWPLGATTSAFWRRT